MTDTEAQPDWTVIAWRDRFHEVWTPITTPAMGQWRLVQDRTEPPVTLDELRRDRGPLTAVKVDNVAALIADLAEAHRCDVLCREVEDERDQLAAETERMRPVVEAAKALREAQRRDVINQPVTVHDLLAQVEEFGAVREAFAAAVDTYEEQQGKADD